MTTENFNPEMLVIAREAEGISQSELALGARISQANLSKIESGIINIPEDVLENAAEFLKCPVDFFFQSSPKHGNASNCLYHRKKQSVSVADLRRITAQVTKYMLEVSHLLRSTEIDSENRFHRMDVVDFGNSPEIIAQLVRRSWGIPAGAIKNLTETIEDAGGIIIGFSFGTNKIDAMSQWAFDLPPIICINTDAQGDRLRYSLAHELGHIVMHQIPTIDLEKEADRFASEFLMPKIDVAPYLNRLSLAKLASLKPLWKVSMQALLERAYSLNKITSNQRQYLWRQISKSGYRTKEPVEIPIEKPKTIYELIEFHQHFLGYSQAELSSLLRITTTEFQRKYLINSTENTLRLV